MGLASLSVPPEDLEEIVNQIAEEMAGVPPMGLFHHKEVLNTDLEIMGVGALFRYHGQKNAFSRLLDYKREPGFRDLRK